MTGLAIAIVTLAITLIIAFVSISAGRDQIVRSVGTNNVAFNATNTLTAATATVPTFIPIVVIAVIGGVLLGLVRVFRR